MEAKTSKSKFIGKFIKYGGVGDGHLVIERQKTGDYYKFACGTRGKRRTFRTMTSRTMICPCCLAYAREHNIHIPFLSGIKGNPYADKVLTND